MRERRFAITQILEHALHYHALLWGWIRLQSSKIRQKLIELLSIFHGSTTENPYFHIRDFLEICGLQRFDDVTPEQLQLLLFPHSLKDEAKQWLNLLSVGSITTWDQLSRAFLMRYFPAQKTNALRKEIMKFKQFDSESLYECWERYKKLFLEFPHHGFPNWQRVQYFYEGLRPENRQMVDITVGVSLATKTPGEALEVFEMISESSQTWDSTLMRSHQSDVSAEKSSKKASLENAVGKILQMMQLQNDKIQDLQTGFQTIGASMSIIQNMQDLMSRMEAQMSQFTVADQTTRVPEILPIQPEIVMAITVQQSEEKVKRSHKKKKVEEPLQEVWDPRYEPLPFPQAPGWGEIARSRGRPVPESFMENRTIDKKNEIEFADD